MANEMERIKASILKESVTQLGRDILPRVQKAFEHVACSCLPKRQELAALEILFGQHRAEIDTIHSQGLSKLENGELGQQIKALRDEVRLIDQREHKPIDMEAKIAAHFFKLWAFQQLNAGNELNLANGDELARGYAQAWQDGWRP